MIIIGKIKEVYHNDELPSIRELMQESPIKNKEVILSYLKNPKYISAVAPGFVNDVLTGERIPGEFCCFEDGQYGWRSDTVYYFDKYNMKLLDEFIVSILDKHPK